VSSSRRIRGREREAAAIIFQSARFGIDVALLLPNTRGQKERGDAIVFGRP
jgi:hypothetical protein